MNVSPFYYKFNRLTHSKPSSPVPLSSESVSASWSAMTYSSSSACLSSSFSFSTFLWLLGAVLSGFECCSLGPLMSACVVPWVNNDQMRHHDCSKLTADSSWSFLRPSSSSFHVMETFAVVNSFAVIRGVSANSLHCTAHFPTCINNPRGCSSSGMFDSRLVLDSLRLKNSC